MKHAAPLNLVHIDEYGRSRKGVSPGDASRLLHKCRALALERLTAAVSGVMNKVDDNLFELADKAENNAIQSIYFDAMREVRIRRGNIETEFSTRLVEGYNRAVKGERGTGLAPGSLNDPEPALGLVEDDDLEESLAVDGMASKVRESCEAELLAFDKRMGVLLGDPDLEGEGNPLAPEIICGTFREACDPLSSGIQVRLILLKLFDKYAAVLLPQLYSDLNRYLIDNDVLPKIPQSTPHRSSVPRVQPPGPAVAQPPTPAVAQPPGPTAVHSAPPQWGRAEGGNALAALHQLLALNASAQNASGVAVRHVRAGTLERLTQLQRGDLDQVPGASLVLDAAQLASGGVNVLHQLKEAPIHEASAGVDDLTIDIVAMLFDFVLDDRGIPDFMKALIGRLQIPMLKVAMLDRSVFSKRTHPARRLVNALADAAVGWTEVDQTNNPVFAKARTVIHRVLGEFEEDVGLFGELLEEFERFRADVEREAEQRAKASVKVIQGKEQLDQAKALARKTVARRISGTDMPSGLRHFLKAHWADFLTVAYMADGECGRQWQSAVDVMDGLVWSVEPKTAAEDRAQLVRMLPKLLRDLKEGMEIISVDAETRSTFLAELANFHARAVSRTARGHHAPPGPEPAIEAGSAAPDQHLPVGDLGEQRREPFADVLRYGGAAHGDDASAVSREPLPDTDALVPEQAALPPATDADGEDMLVEEITIQDLGEAAVNPEDADEYLELAQSLQLGTWVEFRHDDGAKLRARLTWVSSATGVYLFTDRKGLMAVERTPAGLAAEFRRASAIVIKRVPLFDRAVSSLMDGMKRGQAGAVPASA